MTNLRDSGLIEAGAAADMLLLDWASLNNESLREDINPLDLLFSRATARHIREIVIGGRTIVRDGRVLGVDLPGDPAGSAVADAIGHQGQCSTDLGAIDAR